MKRGVVLGAAVAASLALGGPCLAGEPDSWAGRKAVRALAGVAAVTGSEEMAKAPRGRMPEDYRTYDPYRHDKAVAARAAKEYAPRAKQAAQQAQVNRVLGQQAAATSTAIGRARSLGAPAVTSKSSSWWYWWPIR